MANSNTRLLLDKAQKLCQPPTQYELSKRTGIKQTTLSRCRKHGKTLSDANAARLAVFLGMPTIDVIAYMNEDRARSEEQRALWERMLPRLVPPMVAALIVTGLIASAAASKTYAGITGSPSDTLYILRSRKLREWIERAARRIAALTKPVLRELEVYAPA